ncbi:imidazoleglycerol phosphate synthase [Coprinopsis cinerea okayama7|uniref:Imidazole glycerol phosphate synthase hisHF n=1 Tax=Coprinopsis cinerea (strain Okayama-7 / 130 / ATCC MYA-4618 / FGSC 9003) TaxID=240176 RepID=A8N1B5_COPC7|nr:imidazoleglycerol phosphate synthase [Coprinopsis cinerea okayama7\|eukprot:XP_001828664.1 imidazoleglycerol phosphate synthase [Coprinopsis cinerea okayama7\
MSGLYLLDYGAGNVQSLANSLKKLGYQFTWISKPEDFQKATNLIFPGVGSFQSAIGHLQSRGLLEPLREYIKSGKPYFGICIGMQVLFESSAEASLKGLGIIPCPIEGFDDSDKAVPHMGWNAAEVVDPSQSSDGAKPSTHYYFVHSYCAKYNPEKYPEAMSWAYTTTQYGQEIFLSSVRKANVFGTQFHPEKSGEAGLALIDAWLKESPATHTSTPPAPLRTILPKPSHSLTKRIVACMDVRANDQGDLVVTKGDQYDVREKAVTADTAGAVRNLGKPVTLAEKYFEAGADELCLLNITSFRHSPLRDQPMLAVVRAAAERVFVPLTIGGGIKDSVDPDGTPRSAIEVAGAYFRAGADKVSIGSEAVYAVERLRASGWEKGDGTSAIETIAHAYGRQAVVVSIDPKRCYVDPATYQGPYAAELVYGKPDGPEKERGKAWWYQCTVSGGRETRDVSAVELARGVEILGAGEILVNLVDRDGTGLGFDLDLVNLIKRTVKIPVVASSGAGSAQHFVDVFTGTPVEAALAAGIFHREEVKIEDVKRALKEARINVRDP